MSTPKSLIQGVPKLTASNYSSWLKGVTGALRSQGPWRRINDIGLAPPDLSASIKYEIYLTALEKAAGIIYRTILSEVQWAVEGKEDDPKAMLNALKEKFGSANSGSRFNALNELMNISQGDTERIEESLR